MEIERIMFSIIIPVYNREDSIKRCIQSVKKQDFISYELLIINDGSTDRTSEIIAGENSKNKFIVINNESNKGVNFSRNRGIEKAKGNFIIFLDSDDSLSEKALLKIQKIISEKPYYDHYLFNVSDRANDKTLPNSDHEYNYKDWLSGSVTGDFAHVIKPECFKDLMFIEEFRIYESLNWLRILKRNRKQLFIPLVVLERERGRKDSVTRESNLDNKVSMRNTYNYLCKFIDWYAKDYKFYKYTNKLNNHIINAVLLGIALKKTEKNVQLIKMLDISNPYIFILRVINSKFFSPLVYHLIRTKSLFNQIRSK
jgi:glycosyltransferase involved in cell wall biosynthesis